MEPKIIKYKILRVIEVEQLTISRPAAKKLEKVTFVSQGQRANFREVEYPKAKDTEIAQIWGDFRW